jgi:hypothetical protein
MATLRLAPAPTFRWSSSDYDLNAFAIQIRAFGPLIEATELFPAALTAIEAKPRLDDRVIHRAALYASRIGSRCPPLSQDAVGQI